MICRCEIDKHIKKKPVIVQYIRILQLGEPILNNIIFKFNYLQTMHLNNVYFI